MQKQTISSQHGNIDAGEVAKFSQTVDKWWDRDGEFRPLHDVSPLCFDYIDDYVGLAGERMLDVGYGDGILPESMAKCGAEHVTGIDMAEKSPQTAAVHAASQRIANIDYRCIHVGDSVAEQPHSFDVVTCMGMMGHVPGPAVTVQACARLVKPNDMAFFSTTSRSPKSYLHLIVGAECLSKFAPKDTHDWKEFITPAELAHMCHQTELDTVGGKGMAYSSLNDRYSLCNSTEVNYMVACCPA